MRNIIELITLIIGSIFCLNIILRTKNGAKEIAAALLWPLGILWNQFSNCEVSTRKHIINLQGQCLVFLVMVYLLSGWIGSMFVYGIFSILVLTSQEQFTYRTSWHK